MESIADLDVITICLNITFGRVPSQSVSQCSSQLTLYIHSIDCKIDMRFLLFGGGHRVRIRQITLFYLYDFIAFAYMCMCSIQSRGYRQFSWVYNPNSAIRFYFYAAVLVRVDADWMKIIPYCSYVSQIQNMCINEWIIFPRMQRQCSFFPTESIWCCTFCVLRKRKRRRAWNRLSLSSTYLHLNAIMSWVYK